jgi:hypothetical protein
VPNPEVGTLSLVYGRKDKKMKEDKRILKDNGFTRRSKHREG